jgi:hypothetical protein
MNIWLEIPRRHPDGRHKASETDKCAIGFSNFEEILSWIEPRPDGVALSSGRLHFSCTQFPYQGLARPDHDICRPESESDARNFHIWRSRIRTMKTVVRTSEFWMHDLWMSASGHESTSSGRLQLSSHICVLERNPIADRTLSGVRTCYWSIRTDASWSSSKLLDTGEGPNGKFSSSGRTMLGQLSVWMEYHVVRTVARDLISLTCRLSKIF